GGYKGGGSLVGGLGGDLGQRFAWNQSNAQRIGLARTIDTQHQDQGLAVCAAWQPVLGTGRAREIYAKRAVGMPKQLLAVEAVATGGIVDQSAIFVIDRNRPPAGVERGALDCVLARRGKRMAVAIGARHEIASNGG